MKVNKSMLTCLAKIAGARCTKLTYYGIKREVGNRMSTISPCPNCGNVRTKTFVDAPWKAHCYCNKCWHSGPVNTAAGQESTAALNASTEAEADLLAEVRRLREENSIYRSRYGCPSCGEQHPAACMCPPHEVRTTGLCWFDGVRKVMTREIARLREVERLAREASAAMTDDDFPPLRAVVAKRLDALFSALGLDRTKRMYSHEPVAYRGTLDAVRHEPIAHR